MVSTFTMAQVDYVQREGKESKTTYTLTCTNYDATNGIALTPGAVGMANLVTQMLCTVTSPAQAVGTSIAAEWNGSMSAPVVFSNQANAGSLNLVITTWGI